MISYKNSRLNCSAPFFVIWYDDKSASIYPKNEPLEIGIYYLLCIPDELLLDQMDINLCPPNQLSLNQIDINLCPPNQLSLNQIDINLCLPEKL